MSELKPCPFCGWHAVRTGATKTIARCDNADCFLSSHPIKAEVWNTRPSPAVSEEQPGKYLPWTPEETAKRFHDAYEELAPSFGYQTRKESAVPWEQVPENNRALMIAVVRNVLIEQVAAIRQALALSTDTVSVPKEPTWEMEVAACEAADNGNFSGEYLRRIWRAMLAAAAKGEQT